MHQMQKPNARQSSSANVYQNISESKRKKYRQNFLILIVFLRAARSQNKLTLVISSDVNFNSNRHKCKNHHKMIAICCFVFLIFILARAHIFIPRVYVILFAKCVGVPHLNREMHISNVRRHTHISWLYQPTHSDTQDDSMWNFPFAWNYKPCIVHIQSH